MESSEDDDSSSTCYNVLFRRARTSDVDDIVRIYGDSIEQLDKESKEWIQNIVKRRSRRIRVYIASYRNRVIGFSIVYKKRGRAYIDAFAIDPIFRGRGIGQCLLSYVENVLVRDGVKRVYLTVKNQNNKALGIYIKNGYRISNLVLILEASSEHLEDGKTGESDVTVKVENIKRSSLPKVRLLDTAIWSNFTWDVDEDIYKIVDEEVVSVAVYRGKRIAGIAQISKDSNKIIVERLALSYYRPSESLKILVDTIRTSIASRSEKVIVIPIDSSKSSLLRTLISIGFKISSSEYVLYKDLLEDRYTPYEKNEMMVAQQRATLASS